MKLLSESKINDNGIIFSNELITEKEGYEAMLYMLKAYWESTGSNDLTDILSGGEYWLIPNSPAEGVCLQYMEQ